MSEFATNPCVRCGRERVKGKVKFINVDSRKTKLTMYVCPDKECQKIVEAEMAAREERRLSFAERKHYPPRKTPNKS
jgi:hypothetical protein